MKGLILAAGEGKRLRPLTLSVPKAIIPVYGLPMGIYPMRVMAEVGVTEFGVVVWRKDEFVIQESLQDFAPPEWKLTFIRQEDRLGTAHALRQAQPYVGQEPFCLAFCDHVSQADLKGLIGNHRDRKPLATLLTKKAKPAELSSQVVTDGDLIKKIVEKPQEMLSDVGPCGVMMLNPKIFSVLGDFAPGIDGEYHINDALQTLIDRGEKVYMEPINVWRVNVNTYPDLKRAESHLIAAAASRQGSGA